MKRRFNPYVDPSQLVSLKKFRSNPWRANSLVDPKQLIFLRNPSLCPFCKKARRKVYLGEKGKKNTIQRYQNQYRKNPAPDGSPWGPKLYNPLEDSNHQFKDESHYQKMIAKLRRNPYKLRSL